MNRWKSLLLNRWRAKIVSLAVATLVWFALRHVIAQSPVGSAAARPVSPLVSDDRLALAFAESGVEKLAQVFPSFYVEF